jgi:5'-methylthioadenosine phosphorylase
MGNHHVGIIGSAEFVQWPEFEGSPIRTIETEHGVVQTRRADFGTTTADLVIRGGGESIASHHLNHRANIVALTQLEVKEVIGTAMVGSLSRSHGVGSLMIPDQLIDFMKHTPTVVSSSTEYRDYDFTEPYDHDVRGRLLAAADELSVPVSRNGCYVGVDGPRFETRAEVEMYRRLGGDVIGMTGVPEASMAREMSLPYASVVGVVNLGAGIEDSELSSVKMALIRKRTWTSVADIIRYALRRVL